MYLLISLNFVSVTFKKLALTLSQTLTSLGIGDFPLGSLIELKTQNKRKN